MMFDFAHSQQLLVVLTDSWPAVQARLYCLEKKGSAWRPALGPFSAVVGSNGMAWGVGFPDNKQSGPVKKEGDRKAPAGVFRLVKAMGYARTAPEGSTFPYEQIRESSLCVDDPASEQYNRILDTDDPAKPVTSTWKSAEVMKRKDDLYKWLVIVDYNREQPEPGAGSCIFIHVWRSKDEGTAGCTAIAERNILELLLWLKPERNPLLVQMPGQEYELRWYAWSLPSPELLRR